MILSYERFSSRAGTNRARQASPSSMRSIRFCFDHHFPEEFKLFCRGSHAASYFDTHRTEFGSDADYIYGPYFMSYEKGSYFRAHRDVANHKNDPPRLAAHRWSLLLYLSGRESVVGLPAFEGGALIVYEIDPASFATAAW